MSLHAPQPGHAGLEPFGVALAQFTQRQAEAAAVAAASQYFNSVNGGQYAGWPPGAALGQAGGYGPFAAFGQFMGSAPSFGRPWTASGSGCLGDGLPSNTDNGSGLPDMPSTSQQQQQQQQQLGMTPQAGSGPSCWAGASAATGLLPPPSWRSLGTKLPQPSNSGRTTNDGTTMAAPQHLHLHLQQQGSQQRFAYPLASGLSVPSNPSGAALTGQRATGPWMGVLPSQQAPGGAGTPGMGPPSGDELVMRLLRGDAPAQQQAAPGPPGLACLAQTPQQQQQQLSMLQERQLSHAAAGPSAAAAAPKPQPQQTPQQSSDSMKAQLGERNYYTVRAMLVRQQEAFIGQVWELHRLHRTQRYLMRELACPEHALTAHYEAQSALSKPAAPAADAAAATNQEAAAAAAAKVAAAGAADGAAAQQPARLPLAKAVALVQPAQKAAAAAAAPAPSAERPSDALSTLTAHIHLMACIPASIRKVFQAPEPASGSDDAAACLAEEAPLSPPVEPLDAKDFWVTKEAVGVVRPVASRIQLNAAGTMSGDTTVQAAPGSPATLGASANPQVHAASKPTPLRASTNADSAPPQLAGAAAVQPAKQLPSLPLPPPAPLMGMRNAPMPVVSAAGALASNCMQRPSLPPSSVQLLQQQQQQQQALLFQQQQAQQQLLLQQQAQVTAAAAAAAAGPSQGSAEQQWAEGAAAAAASRAVPTDSAAVGLNLFRPTPQISPMFASRFLSGQQAAQQLPPIAGSNAAGFDPHAFWFAKHCEARQQVQSQAAGAGAAAGQGQKRVAGSHGLPPHPGPLAGQPGRVGHGSQAAGAPQLLPMQPPPAVNPSTHQARQAAGAAAAPSASGQQRHNVLRWWQDPAAAFGEPGLVDADAKLGNGGARHHSPPNGGEVTSALTGPSSSKPSSLKRPSSHAAAPLKKRVKYGLDGVSRSPELPHGDGEEEAARKQRGDRPRSRSKSPHKVSPHKVANAQHAKGVDKRSAFKRVVPTKVRSKRGSNRARTESIGSDNSTSSIDKGGKAGKDEPRSVVGGKGAVAPAPSATITATAPGTSGVVSHVGHQSTAKSAAGILLSLSSSFHGP